MRAAYIDPGKNTGVALYPNGPARPIVTKLVEPTSAEALALCKWLVGAGFTNLFVEDQHLPRPRIVGGKLEWRLDWPKLQKLILAADRWVVCAELAGLRTGKIKPSEWQGPMHASEPAESKTKQKSRSAVERTWSSVLRWDPPANPDGARVVQLSKICHNVCDAMLIGRWHQLYGGSR